MPLSQLIERRYLNGKGYQLSHYEIQKKIGKGGFSQVYQARKFKGVTNDEIGENVAIKIISNTKQSYRQLFQNELSILKSLNGVKGYFIKLHSYWTDSIAHYLVLEKCTMGSLDNLVQYAIKSKKCFQLQEILLVFRQMLKMLVELHQKCIINRDIKPHNLLFDKSLNLKMIDFGLAVCLDKKKNFNCHQKLGTPIYMAPEVLSAKQGHDYSFEVDIWATAVVIYLMVYQTHHVQQKLSRPQTFRAIQQQQIDFPQYKQSNSKTSQLIDILKAMFNKQPKKRPHPKYILQNSLFKIIEGKEKKIKEQLQINFSDYFTKRRRYREEWSKNIDKKVMNLDNNILRSFNIGYKVYAHKVLYLQDYGHFIMLSNLTLHALLNDGTLVSYTKNSKRPQQEIQQLMKYVWNNYFHQEQQGIDQLAQLQQPECHLISVVAIQEGNCLFTRLSNHTVQLFGRLQEEQYKISLVINNNKTNFQELTILQKNNNQTYWKEQNYKCYEDMICSQDRQIIQYARSALQIMLDSSEISLKKHQLNRRANAPK